MHWIASIYRSFLSLRTQKFLNVHVLRFLDCYVLLSIVPQ